MRRRKYRKSLISLLPHFPIILLLCCHIFRHFVVLLSHSPVIILPRLSFFNSPFLSLVLLSPVWSFGYYTRLLSWFFSSVYVHTSISSSYYPTILFPVLTSPQIPDRRLLRLTPSTRSPRAAGGFHEQHRH